jgi:hypothetical protein
MGENAQKRVKAYYRKEEVRTGEESGWILQRRYFNGR